MSRNLNNPSLHRDYGATSSGVNAITSIPDVSFSGFSPTEFMSLSDSIASNIQLVKSSWQQLERANKQIGTSRDTKLTRDKVHQLQAHTNPKIQMTSKDLQRLTAVVQRDKQRDKPQKLQLDKLTDDFRTVVERYSASQQQVATKMKQILLQSAHAMEDDEAAASDANLTALEREQVLMERQRQIESNMQFEQDMLLERETRIREIEADVLDVNEIMRELSSLVNLQGEQIDTIEGSIDHTVGDIEAGAAELLKAAEYRTRYRKKVLILLAIAVIIGLIVTGIIVSQLRS